MHMHAYPQDARRCALQLLQASAAQTTPAHQLLLSGPYVRQEGLQLHELCTPVCKWPT
jgi:hypothetical protein